MSRRLEPQDLYAIKLVEDPQIAPDGKRIAYVTAEIDRQTYDYHRTIWVAPADGTPGRRFTAGDHDTTPRWRNSQNYSRSSTAPADAAR